MSPRRIATIVLACAVLLVIVLLWLHEDAPPTPEPPPPASTRRETNALAAEASTRVEHPQDDPLTSSASSKPVRTAFTKPFEIHGRACWSDGTPAVGATIQLRMLDTEEADSIMAGRAPDRSRANGHMLLGDSAIASAADASFAFTEITGACEIVASARRSTEPEPSGRRRMARVRPLWTSARVRVEAATDSVVLTLVPGVPLAGTVHDEDGKPVDRFQIHARRTAANGRGMLSDIFENVQHESFRRAAGRFEWSDLAPETWDVVATAPGFVRSVVVVADTSTAGTTIDLVVRRPATIEGDLVDSSGAPMTKTWIGVKYADDLFWMSEDGHAAAYTDESGHFRIERVMPGACALDAQAGRDRVRLLENLVLRSGEERRDLRLVFETR